MTPCPEAITSSMAGPATTNADWPGSAGFENERTLLTRSASPGQDDRPVLVDEHAVLEVPVHGAREHRPLDVTADHGQRLRIGLVGHAADVLLDDRTLVEVFGGVMGRGADDLHAAVVRASVWLRTGESEKERMVDIDHPGHRCKLRNWAENLHIAREGDKIDLAGEQIE